MLYGRPTKYGTGIEFYGDYYDLKFIHSTIHEMSIAMGEDREEHILLMNFAYEIRKAYQLERDTIKFGIDKYDKIEYRAFKYTWIESIVTIKCLRELVSYAPVNEKVQAVIYTLEAALKDCLIEYDLQFGLQIIEILNRSSVLMVKNLRLLTYFVTVSFLEEKKGKTRFRSIINKLPYFNSYTPENKEFETYLIARTKELNCTPKELEYEAWNIKAW